MNEERTLRKFNIKIKQTSVQSQNDENSQKLSSNSKKYRLSEIFQKNNNQLHQKVQMIQKNAKLSKLILILKNHCGRNFPLRYKDEYNFEEYWQDRKNKQQNISQFLFLELPHWAYYILAYIVLISKIFLIWYLSIQRIYCFGKQLQFEIMDWALATAIIDLVFKLKILNHYEHFKQHFILRFAEAFWKDLILLAYCVTFPFHFNASMHLFILFDIPIVVILFQRCIQIKIFFKFQISATSYKDVYALFDLFSTLLGIGHTFAILLFAVTNLNDQKNWIINNNIENLSALEKYLYSVYFALTTMLTIGYGDISPVNNIEIILILFTQIFGVITYGYILNQIGRIINDLRKQSDLIKKDISNLTRIAKYYELDKTLVERAKFHIVSQNKQNFDISPQEEQNVFSKLNDDLRQQIKIQNGLKIVKSSLFCVCNWTKKFQTSIAQKLHKKIFSPGQEIVQIPKKQRVYIFKKGKVELSANRSSGYKRYFKKILRVIDSNQSMQVSDNIYGYSFIMSNSPIKLKALTKDFVTAFYIQKKDFLEAVMESHLDRQHYFSMKTKIDLTVYPESREAPLIINIKQHYIPGINFLIKKNKNIDNKDKNIRSQEPELRRFRKRSKKINLKGLDKLSKEFFLDKRTSLNYSQLQLVNELDYKQYHAKREPLDSQPIETRGQQKSFAQTIIQNIFFRKQNLPFLFEQGKQYTFFFKKSNRSEVLKKLQKSCIGSNKMRKQSKKTTVKKALTCHFFQTQ